MVNKEIIISKDKSLLDSLSLMDKIDRKLLIVCDGDKFLGVISIGDIQRALLKKKDLSLPVSRFIRKKIVFAVSDEDIEKVKARMRLEKIESMPVIDNQGNLCDIIEWGDLFESKIEQDKIDIPVVIMAGGKGSRLLPLTNIIPKPLIPVSDKTIIEEIMTKFVEAGCNQFYLSVNYLTETIKDYFEKRKFWNIQYIQEEKPLGTGGSLYLLKNQVNKTFFVTNCDTLINTNYAELYTYHKRNQNIVTVISAIKTIHIPYGTMKTEINGIVKELHEKPDYTYQVNTGFYIFEPQALDYIDNGQFLNITDLIEKLIKNGEKVGAFPVSDGSWVDIGNWDEYLKLVDRYVRN